MKNDETVNDKIDKELKEYEMLLAILKEKFDKCDSLRNAESELTAMLQRRLLSHVGEAIELKHEEQISARNAELARKHYWALRKQKFSHRDTMALMSKSHDNAPADSHSEDEGGEEQ